MGQITDLLIAYHWDNLMFVPNENRFLGMPLSTVRGVTQGNPMSPMIFNILVDAVVRETLEVVCGTQEVQNGMGWAVGEHNLIFYMYDGSTGGRYHIWVQDALTVSVAMFRQLGLDKKLEKTNTLVCTTGYIYRKCSEAAYKQRATGEGGTFRERKRAMVSCTVCGVTVAASSLN